MIHKAKGPEPQPAKTPAGQGPSQPAGQANSGRLLPAAAWLIAISLTALALFLAWRAFTGHPVKLWDDNRARAAQMDLPVQPTQALAGEASSADALSASSQASGAAPDSITRRSDLHTIIPKRPQNKPIQYTVAKGDSIFEIAANFKIKPESVLWANYDQLNDNPDMISLDMVLSIPPTDGVLYQWAEGDTLASVAGRFEARPEDILNWPGNNIDLVSQQVEPGSLVMIPGGKREFRQWIIPTIARGRAGVSAAVYGSGACEGSFEGAYGSGAFIWPTGNHILSGNDYWDGHLGIDLAAGEGAGVYAADAGVVVFAGWATGGYGNMVMIDHGNGYQTVYAHLSGVTTSCGRSVGAGTTIGTAGSTGNSTGAHLHFEVRYQGGFVSPWYVLPAP
jgi:hypothetical protein